MQRKKFFIIHVFSMLPFFSLSQNLLVNGDFEEENICTEFHINCAPEGWISTADTYNNFFKIPGIAHSGQHCVAIEAGNAKKQFSRTFIRTQLLCHLRRGNKYLIQFYIKSRHNILDSAGICFTPYDFLFEKRPVYRIIPTVYFSQAGTRPRRGDTTWQKISIEYVASGNELYLTLGNFSRRDISGSTGIPMENHFFIFFDDVSLVPEDPNEKICDDWKKTREEIYNFDARHQFLAEYVKHYISSPPDPPLISSTILQKIDTLVLPDIFFEVDKSELRRKSFRLLDSLSSSLLKRKIDSIFVEGHTDSTGTAFHNKNLSQDRATSVAGYLSQKLLPNQQKIRTKGWGSERPVADNRTPLGRQQNRRVEIIIYIRQ